MKCLICKKDMKMKKEDYIFRGCYDRYYECECGTRCVFEIRYNQKWREVWKDCDGNVKIFTRTIKRWNKNG